MEVEFYSLQKIRKLSEEAIKDPESFWKDKMHLISWFKEPEKIREGEPPFEKWFVNGYTNISYNAIDRHLDKSEKVAFYWINEKLDTRSITYRDLYCEVNRASYVLKELGVKKGDSVSLIMPSIPEAVYMSLAVHRLGATLVIHYLGLSEETLTYRLNDCNSRVLIVASKGFRNGNEIRIKDFVDKLLDSRKTPIEKVLVVKRGYDDFNVTKRDVIYEEVRPRGRVYVEPIWVESNEPSTIYYTSGTTGRPKGLYHSTAGYVIALNYAFKSLMGPKENDIWWTISELGWPVWPMANLYTIPFMGLTGVLFEGYIGYKPDMFSRIIERFGVNLVWSSTTTLYTLKSLGEESVKSGDTSTLRLILNTGEPLNPGAWKWLRDNMPHVTIADAYWMTEHLFPVAGTPFGIGEIPYKAGSAGIRFPGSDFRVVDDDGKELQAGKKGYIVLKPISPALAKMHNDTSGERIIKTYWSRFPGYFYTGDYGYMDEDGYLYVLGRADDVIKSGERIGTLEVESVVVTHPAVAEAAVVGYPKEGGEGILVLAVVKKGYPMSEDLANDIKSYLRNSGYIVDKVYLVRRLPKTKSGKIMRRLIRALVRNEEIGDISTLDDPSILEELKSILSEKD
ncbi:AMP-binding protein [Sulfurisphaera ohwakuensis]|uniref:AMP-binding protein n=1 Tax=Sulfurisphaera ohwakuensis TaxID=69656 RepID=A0A650CIH0_SULOH|nr:AMP-binding protein [Sulfurisphaera ohwakuensis]MBB5253808.1 acetyl-CoA synthetase [Sulfurisphaera ohwakuensis]QGR17518.1 AMP-binding protein [Sulfurisphaera ohwakuensis]